MKKIVFIGDSITSAGLRSCSEQIGTGYVRLIHDYLYATQPMRELEVINKGVGGDRITDLSDRWTRDVIHEQPDYISVSIGVNDVWRQLDGGRIYQIYPEQFEVLYHTLLKQAQEETSAQLILMEPTVIEEDVQSEGNKKLVPYVGIVRELAKTYNAVLVPTHQAFLNYIESGGSQPLTTDGVHMTSVGDTLMTQTWLKAVDDALGLDQFLK